MSQRISNEDEALLGLIQLTREQPPVNRVRLRPNLQFQTPPACDLTPHAGRSRHLDTGPTLSPDLHSCPPFLPLPPATRQGGSVGGWRAAAAVAGLGPLRVRSHTPAASLTLRGGSPSERMRAWRKAVAGSRGGLQPRRACEAPPTVDSPGLPPVRSRRLRSKPRHCDKIAQGGERWTCRRGPNSPARPASHTGKTQSQPAPGRAHAVPVARAAPAHPPRPTRGTCAGVVQAGAQWRNMTGDRAFPPFPPKAPPPPHPLHQRSRPRLQGWPQVRDLPACAGAPQSLQVPRACGASKPCPRPPRSPGATCAGWGSPALVRPSAQEHLWTNRRCTLCAHAREPSW
jgi:hypothetical protein